ncbi:MAG: O-antigen ligase family protein [Verrucomicrobiota bacterium]
MTGSPTAVRAIAIYAVCLPLALILGYLLASPLEWSSFGTVGFVLVLLISPLLLRFHHAMLVLGWNLTMIVFFIPSAPRVWLPLAFISFGISIVRRAIDQRFRFISVPELTWPLLYIAFVVLVTAEATGGIKMRSMGGEVYGGKRYILLLGAIVGYFAMTAQRIPKEKAALFMGMFLLSGMTSLIGDVLYIQSKALAWIFWFFPPNNTVENSAGMVRFAGINLSCYAICFYLMARHGVRGLFSLHHPWRCAVFVCFAMTGLLGGFRSNFILLGLIFVFQFAFEGLHRTRLLPVLLVAMTLAGVVTLPFVRKLPYSMQRTLSILPLDVDPVARADADSTSDWRLEIWKAVLPQVPEYLILGKGLALTARDFDFSLSSITGTVHETSAGDSWAALAGDYHNGPLSVMIPFGIWGAIGFLWFMVAGIGVLYRNMKYGDPDLRICNAFLLSAFCGRMVLFFVVYGGFYTDIQYFVGYLAMGVCLNGRVLKPVKTLADETTRPVTIPSPMPRPRSAFSRG